jgi:hypothetical protein
MIAVTVLPPLVMVVVVKGSEAITILVLTAEELPNTPPAAE